MRVKKRHFTVAAMHNQMKKNRAKVVKKYNSWIGKERRFLSKYVAPPSFIIWFSQRLKWNWPLKIYMRFQAKLDVQFGPWKDKAASPRWMELRKPNGEFIARHP